eukprot:5204850-Prymnesium_polylepis.1
MWDDGKFCECRVSRPHRCVWRCPRSCTLCTDGLKRCKLPPTARADDEHIFDSETFVNALPHSISAFFFIRGGCADAYDGPKCEGYARTAHQTFLAHFGLTKEDVPLVSLDLFNLDEPFVEAD